MKMDHQMRKSKALEALHAVEVIAEEIHLEHLEAQRRKEVTARALPPLNQTLQPLRRAMERRNITLEAINQRSHLAKKVRKVEEMQAAQVDPPQKRRRKTRQMGQRKRAVAQVIAVLAGLAPQRARRRLHRKRRRQ